MLKLIILGDELFDEQTEEFVYLNNAELHLEHSLVSISKWESKWHKSFIHTNEKTNEEIMDYIKCMTLDDDVDQTVYDRLTKANIDQVVAYIGDPMTATTLPDNKQSKANREIVTSELIYYWMVSLNIPFECQHWHLNRLITLIQVCNIKNTPPGKKSKKDIMSHNQALNAARRQKYNTKG